MKIKALQRVSKTDPQRFSLYDCDSETLGLILLHAKSSIRKDMMNAGCSEVMMDGCKSLLRTIEAIEAYVEKTAEYPYQDTETLP